MSICLSSDARLVETDLSCIVADSEGWALVFGWRVAIAVLGGERELMNGTGVQLGGQSLVKVLLCRPQALTLLVQHTQQSLRLLQQQQQAHVHVLFMLVIFTKSIFDPSILLFLVTLLLILPEWSSLSLSCKVD